MRIYTSDLFSEMKPIILIQIVKVCQCHCLKNMFSFGVSLSSNTEVWQKSRYRILNTKKSNKVLTIFLLFFIICLWTQVTQISFPLVYIGELLPQKNGQSYLQRNTCNEQISKNESSRGKKQGRSQECNNNFIQNSPCQIGSTNPVYVPKGVFQRWPQMRACIYRHDRDIDCTQHCRNQKANEAPVISCTNTVPNLPKNYDQTSIKTKHVNHQKIIHSRTVGR